MKDKESGRHSRGGGNPAVFVMIPRFHEDKSGCPLTTCGHDKYCNFDFKTGYKEFDPCLPAGRSGVQG